MKKLHFSQKCIYTIILHRLKQLFIFLTVSYLRPMLTLPKISHFCWLCDIKVVSNSNNDLDLCSVAKMVVLSPGWSSQVAHIVSLIPTTIML